jgi:amino acid efflux transporter
VTIGTLAYQAGGSVAPFAAILSNVLGRYGAQGTAVLAVFIIFGTVNAYTTGMSRVFYAVARDGGFPKTLAHINSKTKVPDRALIAPFVCIIPVLLLFYFFNIDLETALLIPSGAAILIYVLGCATGIKILGREKAWGKDKLFPWISLIISLVVLPFVGPLLGVSLAVASAALIYCSASRRSREKQART